MITLKNIHVILTMLDESSFFALAFLAMAAAYLSEQRKRILRDPFFYLLIALVILFSGYSMVLIEERYLWLGMIIILVAGSMLLQWLFKKMAFFKLSRIIVVTIFAASFVRMPLIELYRGIGTGNDLLALNDKIKDLHLNGRVASDEHWSESLFLAFYNDWRYYGERGGLDKAGLRRELQDKKIDYYIDWKPFENDSTLLGSYPEITKGSISELEIYKLAP